MMNDYDIAKVKQQAIRELSDEKFIDAVKKEKDRLRVLEANKKWWHKLFPWDVTLTIKRR